MHISQECDFSSFIIITSLLSNGYWGGKAVRA